MLKGHVFSKQLFEHQIFALFVNTFLNGYDGVASNYKNAMAVTYSGSDVTVDSGAVCIQGRFLEEDTSATISAGTTTAYCKLIIEIDLDEENTESEFNQASYKIISSSTNYPELTQTNIVGNVSGIYQYELARFRTSSAGISSFQDMRTFLDYDYIYQKIKEEYITDFGEIKTEYEEILKELEEELTSAKEGSIYTLKDDFAIIEGTITIESGSASGSATNIAYPEGFNQNNCAVISIAVNKSSSSNVYFGFAAIASDWVAGSGLNRVTLGSDYISINTNNVSQDLMMGQAVGNSGYTSQTVLNYKIVLLKTGE